MCILNKIKVEELISFFQLNHIEKKASEGQKEVDMPC